MISIIGQTIPRSSSSKGRAVSTGRAVTTSSRALVSRQAFSARQASTKTRRMVDGLTLSRGSNRGTVQETLPLLPGGAASSL